MSENEDEPCYLRVYKGDLNHKSKETFEDWNRCNEAPQYFSSHTIGWDKSTDIKIRGIAVCTNEKSNRRLKGVKVYGATLVGNGKVVPISKPDKFERPNCRKWHKPVYCPALHVATKVILYQSNGEASGLGLACRKVIEKTASEMAEDRHIKKESVLTILPGRHETGRSGFTGSKIRKLGIDGDEHAVFEISASENDDHPCYLRVYKGSINHNSEYTYEDWSRCPEPGPMYLSKFTIGWERSGNTKVRGIAVCTNEKKNRRVKGIKVYGVKLRRDGSMENVSKPEKFDRPNCRKWHNAKYCPQGQVATKVVLHQTDGELNGLSLVCGQVVKK